MCLRLFSTVFTLILALTASVKADAEWRLVWEDEFQRDELGAEWHLVSGEASIVDGRLRLTGGGATILVDRPFSPDLRLEFEAMADPEFHPCDLSVTLAANKVYGWQYLLAFGGRSNRANQLLGPGVRQVDENPPFVIEHGKRYRMIAQKEGRRITYTVNDVTILDTEADDPLGGPGFDLVGLVTWAGMLVDNVKVYERATPHPDTPKHLTELPGLLFYRVGRQVQSHEPVPENVRAALDAFNSGDLGGALKAFESVSDPFARLSGKAYILGDLEYREGDGDFEKLAEEFKAAAERHPDQREKEMLSTYSQAAEWFSELKMDRSGRVAAMRLVALGPEENPFYHKARLYQARYVYWDGMEGGNRAQINEAVGFTSELKEIWSENTILRQYTGERIPWGEELNADTERHPAWAAYLREAYARMIRIMETWFDLRQSPDGQLGGGWGDDVELMRTWKQIASISTGTERVAEGIQKLVDGVWDHAMRDGYELGIGDVEHSAEPSADSLPTMLLLRYGDPLYVERNMRSAETIKERFMGIDAKGHPRFKSVYIGADGVSMHPRAGGDTGYHARAMKHFIWLGWWGNREATDWFARWCDGWREATIARIDTKVAGLPPPTIWYPSGDIFPPVEDVPWWDPVYNYYGAPGLPCMIMDSFLAAYYLTGERRFLKPFQLVMDYASKGPLPRGTFEPGTPEWCYSHLSHMGNSQQTALYRWLTGERVYDEYTRRFGDPAQIYRADYDLDRFLLSFERTAKSLRHNLDMHTTEVLSTDRYALPNALSVFGAYTGAIQNLRDAATPTFAVTYETPDTNFAATVVETTSKRLRVWLYSFRDEETEIGLRLWQLIPGVYVLNLGELMDGEHPGQHRYGWARARRVRITHRAHTVHVNVPPGKVWVVDLRLDTPIEVLATAPDLAIHERDVVRTADGLEVTVHNIGSADAKPFTVALQRKSGRQWRIIAQQRIESLPAPRDLVPSTVVARLGVDALSGEYQVMIHPGENTYELCVTNNSCEVRFE